MKNKLKKQTKANAVVCYMPSAEQKASVTRCTIHLTADIADDTLHAAATKAQR